MHDALQTNRSTDNEVNESNSQEETTQLMTAVQSSNIEEAPVTRKCRHLKLMVHRQVLN